MEKLSTNTSSSILKIPSQDFLNKTALLEDQSNINKLDFMNKNQNDDKCVNNLKTMMEEDLGSDFLYKDFI